MIVIIFLVTLFLVDMISYSCFGTKPLIAKKEVINDYGSSVLYKTVMSNIYYCDTTVDTYLDGGMDREQKLIRYVVKKGDIFTCKSSISYYSDSDSINEYMNSDNPNDIEYMKYYVKNLYNDNLDSLYDINKKLNVLIYNFNGLNAIDEKYNDVYMFDYNDFTKDPIRLEIDGFDLRWRGTNFKSSKSGDIFSFYYTCGYRFEGWMGEQKYTESECINNLNTSGIYVFKVNSINDLEEIAFYPESNNIYVSEYKDSYFNILELLTDKEMIITYVVTNNKYMEPVKKVNYIWNFIDNTIEVYQEYE